MEERELGEVISKTGGQEQMNRITNILQTELLLEHWEPGVGVNEGEYYFKVNLNLILCLDKNKKLVLINDKKDIIDYLYNIETCKLYNLITRKINGTDDILDDVVTELLDMVDEKIK